MCHFSYLSNSILTPGLSETPHRTQLWDVSGRGCNEPRVHATWFQLQLYMTRQCGARKERLEIMQKVFVFMIQIPAPLLSGSSSPYDYERVFYLCEDQSVELGIPCWNKRNQKEQPRSQYPSCCAFPLQFLHSSEACRMTLPSQGCFWEQVPDNKCFLIRLQLVKVFSEFGEAEWWLFLWLKN